MEAIQKQKFGNLTAKELHIRIPDDIHKDLNKLAKKERSRGRYKGRSCFSSDDC